MRCQVDNEHPGARCSMMWFMQAAVLQSSELQFSTMRETKLKEKEAQRRQKRAQPYYATEYDACAAAALAENYFPIPVCA